MISKDKIKTIRLALLMLALMLSVSLRTVADDHTTAGSTAAKDSSGIKPCANLEETDGVIKTFIHSKQDTIVRYQLLYKAFDKMTNGMQPLRVLHIGDSHVAGKSFPAAIKKYLEDCFGSEGNGRNCAGISYSYIAKNGATALNFLTPERMSEIQGSNADLVIMSFGTNECHGMGYNEVEHLVTLSEAVERVQHLCPAATILLTTPPGDCLSQRTKYYVKGKDGKRYRRYRYSRKPNPMTTRCAELISVFAEDQKLPVWDLNTIAGGDMAVRNWQKHKMMRKDCIHFYPEGYDFHARLLVNAIYKAYKKYLDHSNFSDKIFYLNTDHVKH